MIQKVLSYQIADSIDIKLLKAAFKADLVHSDADELFYQTDNQQFIYIFKYGAVCFFNLDAVKISEFLKLIASYCKGLFEESMSEEFLVESNCKENRIGYNKIELREADVEIIRLVMLNVSQSVALDYYYDQTSRLLEETNFHTQKLELKGRLDISGTALKKYIGKTLFLKNRIAENLYIFDSPPETWEDETLNKIDLGLKRTFDLQDRFRNISEGLQIIRDNLDLFKDLLQYRQSTMLEWIIIILILVEVVNLFFEKFF
ncbi:RMD1 family protein [Paraflavisolibacter sp. H34]|uniref:RMD1 family protein n=1 Tax=Huijunlia imazamoxiresistens TaxID=3127457 RepID=UPI003018F2EA